MALFDYSRDPLYPDRYKRNKNWVKVLPVPGQALQTAEVTEIQTIIQDNLKQGFNTLFKNGTSISGLRMGVSARSEEEVTISISAGQFYVEGLIVDIPSTNIVVPTSGSYSVGILLEESIITEKEDASLRDPLKGGELYGPAGAARLIWTTSVLIDDPNAFTIGKVIDGVVNQSQLNPFYRVETVLSQYTYERSGHFCVSGYETTSVGNSSRAVADKNKYTSLQNAVDIANSELQQSLSDAQAAKANLENLQSQLNQSNLQANASPTSGNLALRADLLQRVAQAQSDYNGLANLVVTKQTLYQNSSTSLDKASNLLVDKELFSITAGVAYVEGFRVCKADPSIISVPKDLPTTAVDSVKFTYAGTPAKAIRQLLLTDGSTFANIVADNTLLRVTFTNLLYQGNSITASIEVSCAAANTALTDIPSLLLFIEQQVNSVDNTLNAYITYISPNSALSSIEVRAIIKNNLVINKAGASGTSLEITSTSLNERANQIGVSIESIKRNSSNQASGAGRIISDIPSANLGGGGTTTAFQLGFRPVAEILSLVAEMQEDLKPLVRGTTPGTTDLLGDDSIFRIIKVIQGTTTYTEGIDFRLVDQSKIDWSLSGVEPAPGTTYYVSFLYTQPLAINDDFTLDSSTDSIIFIGRTPAVVYTQTAQGINVYNGTFTVSYTYYLAKAGVITLDKDGNFGYILSAASQDPLLPSVPDNLLAVSSFKMFADRITIAPLKCRRLTVQDQQVLSDRVRQNTQNLEIIKLDLEAYRRSSLAVGSAPIGLFNEPVQDLSKLDTSSTLWSASVVPAIQSISAGYIHKDVPIRYTSGGLVSKNETGINSVVTLPYTNVPLISQSRATRSMALSPYSNSVKRRGKLYISSATLFNNKTFKGLTPCDYLTAITSTLLRQGARSPYVDSIVSSVNSLFSSAAEKASDSILSGDAINSVDARTNSFLAALFSQVTIEANIGLILMAEGLIPGSDNYRIMISGKPVTTFVLQNNTPGSLAYPGAIKAKADGTITVRITLPADLAPGVLAIELVGNDGYAKSRISLYNNLFNQIVIGAMKSWGALPISVTSNSALPVEYNDYISEDLLRLGVSNIDPGAIGNSSTLQLEKAQEYPIRFSPINQTFESFGNYYVTGVKLRLKSGPSDGDLNVYLRSANDMPGKITYTRAQADTYQYSTNSALQTTFQFPKPILINRNQNYSLGLESTSGSFNIFTSQLGEPDLINGSTLGDQLYLQGSLYTTKDGNILSELDREDLTYEIDRAKFSTSPVIVDLGTYGISDAVTDITYFCLNTRDIVPKGTELTYEYESTPSVWVKFQPNVTVCLPFKKNSLRVRATLSTFSDTISPAISLEGNSISFYSANAASQIVSKMVTYPDAYKKIDVIVRYVKPVEANIKVFYSPTSGFAWEGQEWYELTLDNTSVSLVDSGTQLYEARYFKVEPSTIYALTELRKKFRYRIEISTTDRAKQAVIKNVMTYVY
jgi:hypothetical protein